MAFKKGWQRQASIDGFGKGEDRESWKLLDAKGKVLRQYQVDVTTGKEVDIFSFKAAKADDFIALAGKSRQIREKLFRGRKANVKNCPICGASSSKSVFKLTIYGGHYHQCGHCGHCFVINRPSKAEVEDFYAHDSSYHATYVDKHILSKRIEQISIPKAEWVVNQFKNLYGRLPRSILDIGAGAGHFVYACKKLGFKSTGVEVSDSGCRFCSEYFNFELDNCDVTKQWQNYSDFDIVTFWGVIEHVTEPIALLKAAHKMLRGRKTMVVCEVPHWNCMSTVVQTAFPKSINRHLDPLGHINCFSETSLITAYEKGGFAPSAAWYYGMDYYEFVTQLLHQLRDDRLVQTLRNTMNNCQYVFDRGRLSDTIILAARPA